MAQSNTPSTMSVKVDHILWIIFFSDFPPVLCKLEPMLKEFFTLFSVTSFEEEQLSIDNISLRAAY